MKRPSQSTRNLATGFALAAALALANPALAALTITTANENGGAPDGPFTPSWFVDTNASLIAGLAPSSTSGNFNLETPLAGSRDVNSLTVNTNLTIRRVPFASGNTTSNNYVTCGNGGGAGSVIEYTLPAAANGYNLTNLTVYNGWADSGRDAQAYTVLYSTVSAPNGFIYLTTVQYNPSVPGGTPTANRVIIDDPSNGTFAANVAKVKFVFSTPTVENGFTGYGAITVGGTAAGSVASPALVISTATETGGSPFTPSWTAETPNLIAALAPSDSAGDFTKEGAGGTSVLTDGAIGTSGTIPTFATCGAGGGSGSPITYTLTNLVNGTDVTNIIVYSGWGDAGRDGQYFTLSYSTIAAPTTFVPITTVFLNPVGTSGAVANRVAISMNDGSPLGSGVSKLKLDFSAPPAAGSFDNGYQGYSEIVVLGNDTAAPPPPPSPYLTQDTLPTRVETFVGDQVVFTAGYSNVPPANLQWQVITGGVTNDIVAATSPTLTLNNVQLADSGSYRLKAVNATNGSAAPSFSAAAPLSVSAPATVGNVVIKNSGQVGPYPFYPAWTFDTNIDLIFGYGSSGAGPGNFSLEAGLAADPAVLTDGVLSNAKSNMVSCGWVNVGAGQSMSYVLPASVNGYDITNITLFGGWPDDGRNEQKYQVLYSTVSAPSTFTSIGTFDYNPSFSDGAPNSTRVVLVPASGSLAQNVHTLQINFNMQSKNHWNGYSEITVNGTLSAGVIPTLTQDITPLTAEDVVGSSLIMTANFSGATSFQWQKNSTNVPGATTTTLTLTNLQLSDTATNGGYRLLGINASGTNFSRGCAVVVKPVPAAVGNVVAAFAYQSSDASAPNTFGPTWDTATLGSSLIAAQNPPAGGFGAGNFNDPDLNFPNSAGGLPVLTDGGYGVFAFDGSHPAFATGGPGAGQYVIYTMGAHVNGYSVTNIQIAGGWNDNGRNSQFYTVSYSTVVNPTTFIPIKAVNISPSFPSESVIRATITPVTGALADNVYAIQVDFTTPGGVPNGYSGYSEISVFGSVSATTPLGAPSIDSAVQSGGDLIVMGTGGYPPNGSYTLLSTTNLAAPIIWTTNSTGTLDGTGAFSNAIPISATTPAKFFRVQVP